MTNPFDDLAKAMKRRENCLNALTRWQAQLAEAEAAIASLGAAIANLGIAVAAAPLPGAEMVGADEVQTSDTRPEVIEGVAAGTVGDLVGTTPDPSNA